MKITISAKGEHGTAQLQGKFKSLATRLKNRRAMMNRIGVQLLNAVALTFREEGHEGKPWSPLKPRTLARRRKGKGRGRGRILEDTGELRRSFTSQTTNDEVRVGTPKIYAPTHEFGRGNIPERRMIPSQRRGLQLAIDVAEKYLEEGLQAGKL